MRGAAQAGDTCPRRRRPSMICMRAFRGLALIGLIALPAVGRPLAAADSVDLLEVFTGGHGQDAGPHASPRAAFGGDISGVHALQGAVQKLIDFRPSEFEGEWDIYLWINELGWTHVGVAWVNYGGDIQAEGDNETGTGVVSCQPGGGWAWTVYSFGVKVGSGTMS